MGIRTNVLKFLFFLSETYTYTQQLLSEGAIRNLIFDFINTGLNKKENTATQSVVDKLLVVFL